jgi:hypothetical protein
MRSICCLLLALAFGVHATDAPTKRYFPDNPRLAVLFQEDQDDRHGFPNTKRTYEEINERDEARRQEILAMPARGKVRTAQDYFDSAVIFHHGQTNDHYRTASSLAWIEATLDPKPKYLYESASTWDRMMLKRDQPQWYGVQPKHDENFKQIGFYPINDTAVTDEERVRFQIKPRARLMAEPDQPALCAFDSCSNLAHRTHRRTPPTPRLA